MVSPGASTTITPPEPRPPDRTGFGNRNVRVTLSGGVSTTWKSIVADERCFTALMPVARLSAADTLTECAPRARVGSWKLAVPDWYESAAERNVPVTSEREVVL